MSKQEITLIALTVRKWELEVSKITFTSYFVLNDTEQDLTFDVSIMQPPEMVEEYLGKFRYEAEQKLRESLDETEIEIVFENETFLRQKIYNYFKRITSELNSTRRKKGQPKMIFTTHMDVYNENQDISFLPARLQFFVGLNWARKYYEKEEYKKAIEPLRKLIKTDPNYGTGYQWLARSLKKIRKYDEAMRYYEKYAEVENTTEAWLDLAKSLRKGKLFEQSEQIYQRILKEDPKNIEARIGIAQIRYANNDKGYLKILNALYKEAPEWTRKWLNEEFNFRIYVSEKTPLSPNQAAKFLGFMKIFDLTQRAFKNELPSHFNPSKARLSFYKEELENWAKVMNRFKCQPEEINLYPERIDQDDYLEDISDETKNAKTAANAKEGGRELTKVEEILTHIRKRKAERLAEQAEEFSKNGSKGKHRSKGSAPSKKTQRSRPKAQSKPRSARKTG